jgi:hypothetical protein
MGIKPHACHIKKRLPVNPGRINNFYDRPKLKVFNSWLCIHRDPQKPCQPVARAKRYYPNDVSVPTMADATSLTVPSPPTATTYQICQQPLLQ